MFVAYVRLGNVKVRIVVGDRHASNEWPSSALVLKRIIYYREYPIVELDKFLV